MSQMGLMIAKPQLILPNQGNIAAFTLDFSV